LCAGSFLKRCDEIHLIGKNSYNVIDVDDDYDDDDDDDDGTMTTSFII